MNKIKTFFSKINSFFKNLLLDDVDKEYHKPLPYHKKFGSSERQKEYLKEKRINERNQQSKGF